MHLVKDFLAAFLFVLEMPFLLFGAGNWSLAFGVALLLLDAVFIAWACWRSMRFLRTRTRWPEVLHGLPILLVAPLVYVATNGLVFLVFWNWPALPHGR